MVDLLRRDLASAAQIRSPYEPGHSPILSTNLFTFSLDLGLEDRGETAHEAQAPYQQAELGLNRYVSACYR